MLQFKISIKFLFGFIGLLIFANQSFSQNRFEVGEKLSCCAPGKVCSHSSAIQALCQKACAVQDYDPDDLVSPVKASIGDLTRCPVSGVVFRVTALSPMVKYDDGEVYTCCSSCKVIYNQNPEKYATRGKDT